MVGAGDKKAGRRGGGGRSHERSLEDDGAEAARSDRVQGQRPGDEAGVREEEGDGGVDSAGEG